MKSGETRKVGHGTGPQAPHGGKGKTKKKKKSGSARRKSASEALDFLGSDPAQAQPQQQSPASTPGAQLAPTPGQRSGSGSDSREQRGIPASARAAAERGIDRYGPLGVGILVIGVPACAIAALADLILGIPLSTPWTVAGGAVTTIIVALIREFGGGGGDRDGGPSALI